MKNEKKIVIITGISSGFGLATARIFRNKGYKVYGFARKPFEEEGLIATSLDITNYKAVNNYVKEIYEKEKRIDYLINSAGFGISGSIENTDLDLIKKQFEVNYFGTVNISKAVIPYMRENSFGRIAIISSVAAVFPIPFQAFYSSHKAALNLFGEALNIEVKPFGIKVTNFIPGDAKTNFDQNRITTNVNEPAYGKRIEKSLTKMREDELKGMSKEYVAKIIYKNITKKRPPLRKTIGKSYKILVFLERIFSRKFINFVLDKMYGFSNNK